jgi:hypothetical protein
MLEYPCPDCFTSTALHTADCRFEGADRDAVERAYVNILSTVLGTAADEALTEASLKRRLSDQWGPLHDAALGRLTAHYYLRETDDGLEPVTAATRLDEQEPTAPALRTLWEHGSVPGCHDNAIFALISWHELHGFDWEQTCERMLEWFDRTGTWARGGFDEPSPTTVLANKRHVHEEGYGWRDKAEMAAGVVESSL